MEKLGDKETVFVYMLVVVLEIKQLSVFMMDCMRSFGYLAARLVISLFQVSGLSMATNNAESSAE